MDNIQPEILVSGPLAEILREHAIEAEENIITEVFITGDDEIVSSESVASEMLYKSIKGLDPVRIHQGVKDSNLLEVMKSVIEGSTQDDSEVGVLGTVSGGLANQIIVEPPYPPELLADFLEIDVFHYRCVKAKQVDSVGREFSLKPIQTSEGMPFDASIVSDEDKVQISEEIKEIRAFIMDSNDVIGFNGVNLRVAMDYEAIG